MTSTESLKLLTAKSVSLTRTDPGHSDFSWENVAGALGKCSKMAREYAYLKYQLLPEPGHPRLEAYIGAFRMSEVLPIFERENWKSGPLSAMARLVVEDAVLPWTCKACKGVRSRVVGQKRVECVDCSGTGIKRLTHDQRADIMEIPRPTYYRTWIQRYNRIHDIVRFYDDEVQRAVWGA